MSSAKWRPFFLGLNVLIKWVPMCVWSIVCSLQFSFVIYGTVCYQQIRFSCDEWENIYISSYHIDQIGSVNISPLVMISSWIMLHDDVSKWKHFPRYWPFVWGRPVNSPHKGQWHGALMFSLICVWINGWVNNCDAGDLRCCRVHYDVIVMTHCCVFYYILNTGISMTGMQLHVCVWVVWYTQFALYFNIVNVIEEMPVHTCLDVLTEGSQPNQNFAQHIVYGNIRSYINVQTTVPKTFNQRQSGPWRHLVIAWGESGK